MSYPTAQTKTASRAGLLTWLAVLALLGAGLAVRLHDLTDPPLDFHPTRQLRGAIVARGIYYEMLPDADPTLRRLAIAFWNSTGQYEPSLVERLVALTYLALGGENVWVSRIWTSLFWLVGGLALFALARRIASLPAGLVALAYYLMLPFAVDASRSFQPDPGMVMVLVLAVYALYRWSEEKGWKWAVLAGALAGLAVLLKAVAAYALGGAALAVVLSSLGLRKAIRSPQVWIMALLMVLPTALYYLTSRQGRSTEFFETWTLSLIYLAARPSFYARWFSLLQDLLGLGALLAGLLGVLLARPRPRLLLLGLWAGYFVYGLSLPYQTYTHTYYHLQAVPILALSLACAFEPLFDRLALQGRLWQLLAGLVLAAGVTFAAGQSIILQNQEDFRHEPAYWQEIGAKLPTDGKILALTQDYGYRLMYYGWRKVILWPNRGEQNLAKMRGEEKQFEEYFARRAEGEDYFLITAFKQLDDQPDLKQYLESHFQVAAKGGGYLIYDLRQPLQ